MRADVCVWRVWGGVCELFGYVDGVEVLVAFCLLDLFVRLVGVVYWLVVCGCFGFVLFVILWLLVRVCWFGYC